MRGLDSVSVVLKIIRSIDERDLRLRTYSHSQSQTAGSEKGHAPTEYSENLPEVSKQLNDES